MTNCLTSLGEGIASGMQMLAMALTGTAPQVHASYTQQLQAHSPQIPTQAQPRHYPSYTPKFTNMATVYPNPLYQPRQYHPNTESESPRPVFEIQWRSRRK